MSSRIQEAVVKQLHASQHMQGSAFWSRPEHQFGGATFEHNLCCRQVAPSSNHQQHAIIQLKQKHQRQLAHLAQQLADSEKRAEGSQAAVLKLSNAQLSYAFLTAHL